MNEYHVSFILIDTPKPQPEISFNFLPDHVKIVVSMNQGVLLYHIYNGSSYYMCNLNPKDEITCYYLMKWTMLSNNDKRS